MGSDFLGETGLKGIAAAKCPIMAVLVYRMVICNANTVAVVMPDMAGSSFIAFDRWISKVSMSGEEKS